MRWRARNLKKKKGNSASNYFIKKSLEWFCRSLESKDKDIRLTCFKFSCKLISAGKNTEWETYFSVVNDFFSYLSYSSCPRFLNDYLHSNIQCSPPHHTHTCVTFSRHANKVSNDHIPWLNSAWQMFPLKVSYLMPLLRSVFWSTLSVCGDKEDDGFFFVWFHS